RCTANCASWPMPACSARRGSATRSTTAPTRIRPCSTSSRRCWKRPPVRRLRWKTTRPSTASNCPRSSNPNARPAAVPAPAVDLRSLIAPLAILLLAALALWIGPTLPPSLAGLKEAGAYFVLVAAAGMGLWFNRGRAFVAAISILIAYAGYRYALDLGAANFPARAVYTAAVVLVPLNILVALLLPERGVSYHGDYRWLFIVAGEILLVVW